MTHATHFILYVADQARATAFYAGALDLAPRLEVPGMTEFALPGGGILGLTPETGIARLLGSDTRQPAVAHAGLRAEVYLVVDDPKACLARARAAGATPLSPLLPRAWGHVAGYVQDADGNVLAFARDDTSRPARTPPKGARPDAAGAADGVVVSVHDATPPEESACIDRGLGEANDAAAPLHEVRPLSCFARAASGAVVGGAIGRRWGTCCELQQLWVDPAWRRRGLATRLVEAFEAHGAVHGCTSFFLETFSFQAPALYASLGYRVACEHAVYPHGIVKFVMVKRSGAGPPPA